MTITIDRIGKSLHADTPRVFRRLLKSRVLCVVGYFGNDDDIRRAIISSGAQGLLWLVRDWNDRALRNLEHFLAYPGPCFVAKSDLQSFFRALGRLYS